MFIDLDGFKGVNDTAGHGIGDALLKEMTSIMTSNVRQTDLVARLGGDEFVIFLQTCDRIRANVLAEKMLQAVHAIKFGQDLHVSASIGLTTFQNESYGEEETMREADAACYEAKSSGRNCVRSYVRNI